MEMGQCFFHFGPSRSDGMMNLLGLCLLDWSNCEPKIQSQSLSLSLSLSLSESIKSLEPKPNRSKQRREAFGSVAMAAVAESYAARNPDTVHTDVLSKARESCYKARDAFYACLEKESSKKPTEIGSVGLLYPAECKRSRAEYENQCRASWVKHFDRQYCRNKTLQRLLDDKDSKRGPLTLPQPSTFKTPS